MIRIRIFLPLLLLSGITALGASSLELWKAPFGTSYEECLGIWAAQGIFPDLKADGPSFSRNADTSLVFFRSKHFLGFMAQDIQAVFSRGILSKVRIAFHRGQNPQSYFDSYYREIKKIFDKQFFPSNKTLGFVKTGAAWTFPEGENIYMGSIIPSDLVIILEGPPTPGNSPSESLFPRPE